MATVNGAKTLGRDALGSLEPTKAADLFMIDADAFELAGTLHDPRNLLARAAVTDTTALTMVGGQIVWKDGAFTRFDKKQASRQAEQVCTRVLRQNCTAFPQKGIK